MNNQLLEKYFDICEKFYLREKDYDTCYTSMNVVPKPLCDGTIENIRIAVTYSEKIKLLKILKEIFSDNYRITNYFTFLINKTEQEEIDHLNFKYEAEIRIKKLRELNEQNFGNNHMEIEL